MEFEEQNMHISICKHISHSVYAFLNLNAVRNVRSELGSKLNKSK